jgi:hypothetical protein
MKTQSSERVPAEFKEVILRPSTDSLKFARIPAVTTIHKAKGLSKR